MFLITFKTQEMCDKAVRRRPWLLEYVPDWFVTQEQMKLWHDDDDCDDDELIEWYEGYQKTEGPESTNKRRTFAHCLASTKTVELVCS